MEREADVKAVIHLCSWIVNGVIQKDPDSVRSHLEDLSEFLIEKNLTASF